MPSLAEIVRAFYGCLLLARHDQTGFAQFENTIGGFWRSFTAIVFIIPPFYLSASIDIDRLAASGEVGPIDRGAYLAAYMTALVIHWGAYPLALAFVSRFLGLSHNFTRFVIAYNWFSVLVTLALTVPSLLYAAGIIGDALATTTGLILIAPVLYFHWFIARAAFETTGGLAASLVALDIVLAIFLPNITFAIFN